MIKVVTSWQILFSLAKKVGMARQALISAEQLCEDTERYEKELEKAQQRLSEYEEICTSPNSIMNLNISIGNLE